jgi:hypothetical protein
MLYPWCQMMFSACFRQVKGTPSQFYHQVRVLLCTCHWPLHKSIAAASRDCLSKTPIMVAVLVLPFLTVQPSVTSLAIVGRRFLQDTVSRGLFTVTVAIISDSGPSSQSQD